MYPYNQQLSQLMLQQAIPQATKQEVIKVNGKNGANAFQLAPDSSALLLDTSAPLVWLVQTDGAGYKTLLRQPLKRQACLYSSGLSNAWKNAVLFWKTAVRYLDLKM